MRLTKEQLERLSPYEKYFRTAINSRYASYPGISALETINAIYNDVTGIKRSLKPSCGTCILNLLTNAGKIYFADISEREKRAAGRAKKKAIDAANDKAAAGRAKRQSRKKKSNASDKTTN